MFLEIQKLFHMEKRFLLIEKKFERNGGIVKKLDVLLMLLSGLFPIAGLTKQIPLEQSIYIGGLLFFY